MGQHGPLIWDGYLYGLCFILRNYTVRLRGAQREMKLAASKTESRETEEGGEENRRLQKKQLGKEGQSYRERDRIVC